MKNSISAIVSFALLLAACSEETEKVNLSFNPDGPTKMKGTYSFSVNQLKSGDVTSFSMDVAGYYGKTGDSKNFLEFRNENVKLEGNVKGNSVSAVAGQNDSLLENDVRLVALPVFFTKGKTFRSVYDAELNKLEEMQVSKGAFVDSTDSRVQMLLRYPTGDVKVGDSWERDIVLKAGNKMNCSAKYTLSKVSGDTAFIDVAGKITGNGESFGNKVSFDGKMSGAFSVSRTDGFPLTMDVNEEFNLKINGDTIPMIYTIKAKFDKLGKADAGLVSLKEHYK